MILFLTLNTMFLFYTDPGSGALIFQFILAIFFGGLFYFRKIKDFIFKKSSLKKEESQLDLTKSSSEK